MIFVISKPNNSLASSNNFLAFDEFSKRSNPIPVNCAPCPGKIYAFIIVSFSSIIGICEPVKIAF